MPPDEFGFALDDRLNGIIATNSPSMLKVEQPSEVPQTVDPSTIAHNGHYDMPNDPILNQGTVDQKPFHSQSSSRDELQTSKPQSLNGTTSTTPSDGTIPTPCCSGTLPMRQSEIARRDRRTSRDLPRTSSSHLSMGGTALPNWYSFQAPNPQENSGAMSSGTFPQSHSYSDVLGDSSSYAGITRSMNEMTLPIRETCNGSRTNEAAHSEQTSTRCNCGDHCSCFGCPDHYYNETTRNNVQDLGQILCDDLPQSRPNSMHENLFNPIEHTNGSQAFFSAATMTNNVQPSQSSGGQRSSSHFQQNGPSEDYFYVPFSFNQYPMQCAQPNGICPCGPECACVDCFTHSNFQPQGMQDNLLNGHSQPSDSPMFHSQQAQGEQNGPPHQGK